MPLAPAPAAPALLALAALTSLAVLAGRGERYVSTAMGLIGLAALTAAAAALAPAGLAAPSRFTSDLATCVGLPLIAAQYATSRWGRPGPDSRLGIAGAAVIAFAAFAVAFPLPAYAASVRMGASGVVALAAATDRRRSAGQRALGLTGALGLALTGLPPWPDDPAPLVFGAIASASTAAIAVALPPRESDHPR